MQTTVSPAQAPTPPAPPAPPAPGGAPAQVTGIAVPGTDGTMQVIPITRGQRRVLERRRDELSRQLNSVNGRRDELVGQLEEQSGAARAGLEQRIIQLDDRILKLEQQIEENGRALAYSSTSSDVEEAVAAAGGAAEPRWGPFSSKQATAVSIIGTIFVLFPLAMAAAYRLVTRPKRAVESPALADAAQRLSRLETAVDTIAIEVERMTEGQRFMTRLMTEGRMPGAAAPAAGSEAPALGAGQRPMEPVRVRQAETA